MSFDTYAAECAICEIDSDIKQSLCPVCLTQRIFRGKWKIVILWLLRDKELRFSELKKSIPNITQAYLSNQLKSLESDQLVIRKSYNEIPPRVEYSLTEEGRNFIKVIDYINDWGTDYLKKRIDSRS
ncbi:MAG: helix-turn-helix domain-containing protein [Spirochaetales bacterium]|uniref:Helix-turn-helix domain-containing protein n=1 Tax=Candidatus Thalassospirochaeta sargassi TaxID=3119039 RepID=A0AAJ1IB92_9SPIO|nr:helix-turn-helix domain-containing protein [Spirochaetales bacterium]